MSSLSHATERWYLYMELSPKNQRQTLKMGFSWNSFTPTNLNHVFLLVGALKM